MPLVYVALGANLGDREGTIRTALRRLDSHEQIEVERVSSLRETDPVGYEEQPPFLNGVARLRTDLEPRELLTLLLDLERDLGRTRHGPRFGPRTIDLDILLYGDRIIDEPGLRVPHPRMGERAFVLEPLAELDPDLEVPGRGRLRSLLAGLQ
ncbi:MAG TPA: 2-amino-4-hydroxy-6-hydroxymethyldihydropteridine diphosphokinase [Gaiellaceae bacterium]|nr:2-amino-4-hydroxy-6-hydroxymethyldihydropteridine diphosphokinase [Gaiellaceae bacterium]